MAHLNISQSIISSTNHSPIIFNSFDAELYEQSDNQDLENMYNVKQETSQELYLKSMKNQVKQKQSYVGMEEQKVSQQIVRNLIKNQEAQVRKLCNYRKIYKSTDDRKCHTSKTRKRHNKPKYSQISVKQKLNPIVLQIQKQIKNLQQPLNNNERINQSNQLVRIIKSYLSSESKINPSLLAYVHYNMGVSYIKINQAGQPSVKSQEIISFHLQTAYRQFSETLENFSQESNKYFCIHTACSRILLHQASKTPVSNNQTKQFDPLKVIYRACWQSVLALHKIALIYLKQIPVYATGNTQAQQNSTKILNKLYILLSDLAVNSQYVLSLDFGGQNWSSHKNKMKKKLAEVQYLIKIKWELLFALSLYQVDTSAIKAQVGDEEQTAKMGIDEELRLNHVTYRQFFSYQSISIQNCKLLYQGIALYAQTLYMMSDEISKKSRPSLKINTQISQDLLRRCFHICQQYLNKSPIYYKTKSKYESQKWGGVCIRQTTKQQESDFEDSKKFQSKQRQKVTVRDNSNVNIVLDQKKQSIQERPQLDQQRDKKLFEKNKHRIRFMRSLQVNSSDSKRYSSPLNPKKHKYNHPKQPQFTGSLGPVEAITKVYQRARNRTESRKIPRNMIKSSDHKTKTTIIQTQQNSFKYRYNFRNAIEEIRLSHNSRVSDMEDKQALMINSKFSEKIPSIGNNNQYHGKKQEMASQKIEFISKTGIFFKYKNQRLTKIKQKSKI